MNEINTLSVEICVNSNGVFAYNITILDLEGREYYNQDTVSRTAFFELPDGHFKVRVTGDNCSSPHMQERHVRFCREARPLHHQGSNFGVSFIFNRHCESPCPPPVQPCPPPIPPCGHYPPVPPCPPPVPPCGHYPPVPPCGHCPPKPPCPPPVQPCSYPSQPTANWDIKFKCEPVCVTSKPTPKPCINHPKPCTGMKCNKCGKVYNKPCKRNIFGF